MPRFKFELADASNDRELKDLLAATPLPGAISLAFAREPSYFGATEVDGSFVQIGVVKDRLSGRIIGMGSRSISQHFVNGVIQPVGYLSGLRLLPEYRGQAALLARGFAFFHELHQDARTHFYLTTIADDNRPAARLLVGSRARMPAYHAFGRYVTFLLGRGSYYASAKRTTQFDCGDPITVRPAEQADHRLLHEFLANTGFRRQFFPAFSLNDVFSTTGRLKQLSPEQVLLAFQNNKLVGTLGLWNQQAFKQIIVSGYQMLMGASRPFYNAWARFRRRPMLPSPGEALRAICGAIPIVERDDPLVFEQLLEAAISRQLEQNSMLLLGMFEVDPLASTVKRYAWRDYVTQLYIVHWKEEGFNPNMLCGQVPYLELGCL